MSNVVSFRRRGGQLFFSDAILDRRVGAMRRDALDIMRSGDQLIDFVAHPDLMDSADPTLLAASTVGAFR
jgi:hypothetical protein